MRYEMSGAAKLFTPLLPTYGILHFLLLDLVFKADFWNQKMTSLRVAWSIGYALELLLNFSDEDSRGSGYVPVACGPHVAH